MRIVILFNKIFMLYSRYVENSNTYYIKFPAQLNMKIHGSQKLWQLIKWNDLQSLKVCYKQIVLFEHRIYKFKYIYTSVLH